MADGSLFAEERRRRILEMLSRDSRVLVSDLAERFGVSQATLRNDLRELEAAGLLRRTHGGAVAVDSLVTEPSADAAQSVNGSAKVAIGRRAAELVHEGDVIFCDSGSTTAELVRQLPPMSDLTIITNDFNVALMAERRLAGCSIVFIGGTVRNGFHYTTGSVAVERVGRLFASTAFVAANAFSFERGFTTHAVEVAAYKRKLIEHAEKTCMLMDSSKVGTVAMVTFAQLGDVSVLVTDSGITEADRHRILQAEDAPKLVIA